MPRLNVDLKEAESRKALPDDAYPCKVLSISAPKQGAKSKYVEWVFQVTEGEFEGAKIYNNTPVTGKGAGMFVDAWNRVMGTDFDVDQLEDLDIDTDDAIGEECICVTKQKEYPEGSGEYQHNLAKLYKSLQPAGEDE